MGEGIGQAIGDALVTLFVIGCVVGAAVVLGSFAIWGYLSAHLIIGWK